MSRRGNYLQHVQHVASSLPPPPHSLTLLRVAVHVDDLSYTL